MGHKAKKDGHKGKKEVHIPKDWRERCLKEPWPRPWCAKFSDQLTEAQKVQMNCNRPIEWDEPSPSRVKDWCKDKFPKDEEKQIICIKSKTLLQSVHGCSKKRAANLSPDKDGPSVTVYLGLGALLLVIVGVIVAAWYFFSGQKSGRHGAKGASKGQSQSGKSKLSKSKIGSRKSSHRSSGKGSQPSKGTKSRLSGKKK